jgi:hypothetical protein
LSEAIVLGVAADDEAGEKVPHRVPRVGSVVSVDGIRSLSRGVPVRRSTSEEE